MTPPEQADKIDAIMEEVSEVRRSGPQDEFDDRLMDVWTALMLIRDRLRQLPSG